MVIIRVAGIIAFIPLTDRKGRGALSLDSSIAIWVFFFRLVHDGSQELGLVSEQTLTFQHQTVDPKKKKTYLLLIPRCSTRSQNVVLDTTRR